MSFGGTWRRQTTNRTLVPHHLLSYFPIVVLSSQERLLTTLLSTLSSQLKTEMKYTWHPMWLGSLWEVSIFSLAMLFHCLCLQTKEKTTQWRRNACAVCSSLRKLWNCLLGPLRHICDLGQCQLQLDCQSDSFNCTLTTNTGQKKNQTSELTNSSSKWTQQELMIQNLFPLLKSFTGRTYLQMLQDFQKRSMGLQGMEWNWRRKNLS